MLKHTPSFRRADRTCQPQWALESGAGARQGESFAVDRKGRHGTRAVTVLRVFLIPFLCLQLSAQEAQIPRAAAPDFRQAVDHFQASRYVEALQLLNSLEERFPENAEIHHLLAIVLDLSERPDRANDHFKRAAELAPGSATIRTNYGASLRRLGRIEEALEQFRQALQIDPKNGTASFNLGTMLLQQGDLGGASRWLEQAYRARPELYENGYQLAYCQFLLEDHTAVDRILDELGNIPFQRAEFHLLRALNDRALGRDDRSSEMLRRLRPRLLESHALYEPIALLLLSQGMYEDAILLLERARDREPDRRRIRVYLAEAQLASGRLKEAEEEAVRALEIREDAAVHRLLGDILEALQRPLEAVEHFQIAVQLDPSEENLYSLGHEFLIHWNWDVAQGVFDQALKAFPSSLRLWAGHGAAALGRGESDKATESFLKAADLDPENLVIYHLLSQSSTDADSRFEDSVACFERFYARVPMNPWAVYYEALAFFRKSSRSADTLDLESRVARLEKLVAEIPDFSEAQFLLGEIYFDQGKWIQAAAALERGVKLNSENLQGLYKLALVLQRTGERERARETLEQYTSLKSAQDKAVSERMARTTQFLIEAHKESRAKP